MLLRDADLDQLIPQLFKRRRVFFALGLRLEEHNRANIRGVLLHFHARLLLNACAKLDGVHQHVVLGAPVIDDHRELNHVLLFQLTGIDNGDDIAVALGRCGQIQHEGGVQVAQHFNAQLALRVVAFIHNHHRRKLIEHLNQRCLIHIGNERVTIRIVRDERGQIAVFLIDLAAFFPFDAQRVVAQHEDRQVFPHARRRERLPVQRLRAVVDFHPGAKVVIDLLTIRVLRIAQIPQRLFQNRRGGREPHDGLCLHHAHPGEDMPDGRTGQQRFAAAGRHLEAHMRHAGEHVIIGRKAIEADVDAQLIPMPIVRGVQVLCAVQQLHIRIQLTQHALLIVFQFHGASSFPHSLAMSRGIFLNVIWNRSISPALSALTSA